MWYGGIGLILRSRAKLSLRRPGAVFRFALTIRA